MPSPREVRRNALVVRNGVAEPRKVTTAAGELDCVNAPHLVALVRAGATFVDGFIIEREDQWDAA